MVRDGASATLAPATTTSKAARTRERGRSKGRPGRLPRNSHETDRVRGRSGRHVAAVETQCMGAMIAVNYFTVLGDTSRGPRPSSMPAGRWKRAPLPR